MNKRDILLLAVIIIIVGLIGIYFWQNLKPTDNFQGIILLPLIEGCAKTDRGMATKSFIEVEQEPKIEVSENIIKYSRAINHLCCRKVEIKKGIEDSTINIYEVWGGPGCKCMCFSEIGAEIKNVPAGDYIINVYEKGTTPDDESMEQKLITSKDVAVQ